MYFFYSFALFVAAVLGQGIVFTNPAPISRTSPSQNPTFAEDSVLRVTWTEGTSSTATNLVLFQMNGTSLLYPFEYLTRKWTSRLDLEFTPRHAKSTGQKMC